MISDSDQRDRLLGLMRARPVVPNDFATGVLEIIDQLKQSRRVGRLDRLQLLKVIKVKLQGRADASAERTSSIPDDVVQALTRAAFSLDDITCKDEATRERLRIGILTALPGVEVPTASAILAWTFPDRFPVIDRRAWRTLSRYQLVSGREAGASLGAKQWVAYYKTVERLKGQLLWTPQEIDTWLYRADKEGWDR